VIHALHDKKWRDDQSHQQRQPWTDAVGDFFTQGLGPVLTHCSGCVSHARPLQYAQAMNPLTAERLIV
jgi:hypothetical protein